MQLKNVGFSSVGRSIQKLQQTNLTNKIPSILPCKAENIRSTTSRQVSDLAQLADVLKFNVEKESRHDQTSAPFDTVSI